MSVPPPGFGPLPYPQPPGPLPEVPDGVTPRGRWKPWTAFVALLVGIISAAVLAVGLALAGVVFGASESVDNLPGWVNIAATFLQNGAFVGSAIYFARMAGRVGRLDFGLRRPAATGEAVAYVVAGLIVFFTVTAAWSSLLDIHDPKSDLLDELGVHRSSLSLAFTGLLVCVAAPIGEEFLFRGYIFTALRNWRGMWPAAILTGVLFGAIHAGSADPVFLVPLAFFGLVLCVLYDRTGSLYVCMCAHAINNSIAFGSNVGWDWQILPVAAGSLTLLLAGAALVERRVRA